MQSNIVITPRIANRLSILKAEEVGMVIKAAVKQNETGIITILNNQRLDVILEDIMLDTNRREI